MWLKDDLEQLKRNWTQSPWWVRLWMGLSLFLAVSSLASLSETVANWKGFFLDAIHFYREWVVGPFREFAAEAGIRYSSRRADIVVLNFVYGAVFLRALAVEIGWGDRKRKLWFCLGSALFVGTGIWCLYYHANRDDAPVSGILSGIALGVVSLLPFARSSRLARSALFQILVLIVIVGALGAVNAGLSAEV